MADILGASVKLVADDSQLNATIEKSREKARQWGEDFARAYQDGTGDVWRRKVGPTTRTFQGRYGEWLMRHGGMGGGPGGIAGGPGGPGSFGGGPGGLGRRELGEIGRAGGFGEIGRFAGLARAHPYVAIAAAGAAALGTYVKAAKEAADAQRELTRAQESGDPEKVNALLEKRVTAVRDLTDAYAQAHQPVTGLESRIQRLIGTATLAWEALTGPGLDARKKQVEDATKAAKDMWEAFGAPKLAIEQLRRSAAELEANAQAALKAADSAMAYSAAVNMLVEAKKQEEQATQKTLQAELDQLEVRRKAGTITVEEFGAKARDLQQRGREAQAKLARETKDIRQNERRELGEMAAAEIEYTEKSTALARERQDVIVRTLGEIVETESATTLSLEQAYRARAALMQEGTRNALDALRQESEARRQALQARIGGATGQERVRLERELTLVTEQEATKRAEIEAKYTAERIRLFRQAQQEQIALQERVFAIQRTLGERTLHDDLARQTAMARGAQAGSQTQLRALEQVAAHVKALSDQAKDFLNTALQASDDLAKKQGREPSKFVSAAGLGTSLAATTAERFKQLEEAERTFNVLGGEIKREDFEALARGDLDKLRAQREAGIRTLAGDIGRAGAETAGVPAMLLDPRFRGAGVVPGGLSGQAISERAFGAQIGRAFEKPIDTFTKEVGPQFASMVSKAEPAFTEVVNVWNTAVDAMVKKAEDGSSKMERALYENIKRWLARDLDREVKTF